MSRDILSTLLDQLIKEKISHLEGRFQKEEKDLTTLDGDMKIIESKWLSNNLIECTTDCTSMTDRILAKLKEKEEEAKKKAESKHLKTEPSKPSKSVASARKPMKRNQTEAHIKTAKQSHEAPKKTIPNSK